MLAQALVFIAGYVFSAGVTYSALTTWFSPLDETTGSSRAQFDAKIANENRRVGNVLGAAAWPLTLAVASLSVVFLLGSDVASRALNATKPRASLPEAKVMERG